MPNKYLNQINTKEFTIFLFVGIINTTIGLGTIFSLMAIFNLDAILSNVLGYILALINSFILNRKWTFGYSGKISLRQITHFLVVFVISWFIQFVVLLTLKRATSINIYIVQTVSTVFYTISNYTGNKLFTFSKRSR